MKKRLLALLVHLCSASLLYSAQSLSFYVRTEVDEYYTAPRSVSVENNIQGDVIQSAGWWHQPDVAVSFIVPYRQIVSITVEPRSLGNKGTKRIRVEIRSEAPPIPNYLGGVAAFEDSFNNNDFPIFTHTVILDKGTYYLHQWAYFSEPQRNYFGTYSRSKVTFQTGQDLSGALQDNWGRPISKEFFSPADHQMVHVDLADSGTHACGGCGGNPNTKRKVIISGATNWSDEIVKNSCAYSRSSDITLNYGFHKLEAPYANGDSCTSAGISNLYGSFKTGVSRTFGRSIQNVPDSGGVRTLDYSSSESEGILTASQPTGILLSGTCKHSIAQQSREDISVEIVNRGYDNCGNVSSNKIASGWSVQAYFPDIRKPPQLGVSNNMVFIATQPMLSWAPGYSSSNRDSHFYRVVIASSSAGFASPFFDQQVGDAVFLLFPHKVTQPTDYVWKVIAGNPSWPNSVETAGSFKVDPDIAPPSSITDLQVSLALAKSVQLRWTAPGDDGNEGRAAQYDVRYSVKPIRDSGCEPNSGCILFEDAAKVFNVPSPQVSGQFEILMVHSLNPATTYYFAVKTMDDFNNVSLISNFVSARTFFDDHLPPKGILLINNGDEKTNNRNITLDMKLLDTDSLNAHTDRALRMAFSEDGQIFTPLETYQPVKNWELPPVNGIKKVFVKFVDEAENESLTQDTIILDESQSLEARIQIFGSDDSVLTAGDLAVVQPGAKADIVLKVNGVGVSTVSLNVLLPDGNKQRIDLSSELSGQWKGEFTVPDSTALGIGIFQYTGKDQSGNIVNEIAEGERFLVSASPQFAGAGNHDLILKSSKGLGSPPDVRLNYSDKTISVLMANPSGDHTTWISKGPVDFADYNGKGTVDVTAQDYFRRQSQELVWGENFQVDTVSPQTGFQANKLILQTDGTYFAGTKSSFSLMADDPTINGFASGVDKIEFAIDEGPWTIYRSSFSFSVGNHLLLFRSQDRAGNLETIKIEKFLIDGNSPAISILSPKGGEKFLGGGSKLRIQFAVEDNWDSSPKITAQLLPLPLEGFPEYRKPMMVTNGLELDPPALPAGRWKLQVNAEDQYGNDVSSSSAAFEIIYDGLPPQTKLLARKPSYLLNSHNEFETPRIYVASGTPLELIAKDDFLALSDGSGLGVHSINLNVDGKGFTSFKSSSAAQDSLLNTTFYLLNEGVHQVSFFSKDFYENIESTKTMTLYTDNSPPVSSLNVLTGPEFHSSEKQFYVSTLSVLTLVSQDPEIKGSAVGVDHTFLNLSFLNQENFFYPMVLREPYSLSLEEGVWRFDVAAVDRLEHRESTKSIIVYADGSPPLSEIEMSSLSVQIDTITFVYGGAYFKLKAGDPSIANLASGLKDIFYSLDQSSFSIYVSTFGLSEGKRNIRFFSQDQVLNQEFTKSVTYYVDATAPLISFDLIGPRFQGENGMVYLSNDTWIQFYSHDPIANEIASGLKQIELASDSDNFRVYESSAALLGKYKEGLHRILYRAFDRAGNDSGANSFTFAVDHTPPETSWSVRGRQNRNEARLFLSTAAALIFSSHDPFMEQANCGAKKIFVWLDGKPVALSAFKSTGGIESEPLYLRAGKHKLEYQSEDYVGNREPLKSFEVTAEVIPPESRIQIGEPQAVISGQIVIGGKTPIQVFSLSHNGTPGNEWVDSLNLEVDGHQFSVSNSTAFYLSEKGRHEIRYFSVDPVGNVETIKSTSVIVDVLAPDIHFEGSFPGKTFVNRRDGMLTGKITLTDDFDSSPSYEIFLTPVKKENNQRTIPVLKGLDPVFLSHGFEMDPLEIPEGEWILQILVQDRFGNISSFETSSFIIDHREIAAPMAPEKVRGKRNLESNEFRLNWSPSLTRANGNPFEPMELVAYKIYRINSPRGEEKLVSVQSASAPLVFTDFSGDGIYYYKVRAENVDGIESEDSHLVSSDIYPVVVMVLDDSASYLKASQEIIEQMENLSLKVKAEQSRDQEGGVIFKSLNLNVVKEPGSGTVNGFMFEKPVQISFGFYIDGNGKITPHAPPNLSKSSSSYILQGGRFTGSYGKSKSFPSSAVFSVPLPRVSEVRKSLSVYWFNGQEWLKLSNLFDLSGQNVQLKVKHSGSYQLRLVQQASSPELIKVYPRTISPNGDGINDRVFFVFENPADAPISGSIYDMKSLRTADIKKTNALPVSGSVLIWDGKDDAGATVHAGVYLYKIKVGDETFTGTVAVTR